ncbi:hypothetical protein BKA65DRAFT_483707 [Rhexocercosporidium sp. MPI-PUGE-AT-0058]|nr:hypothetical protein BKA65DRAFT_483707 [Rhexocercosporidium sp. MPI-PUGE-AT-0058]
MSGGGPSIDLDCTRDGVQQLASQTAGDGFGAGSYDMTERQARHRQDMNGAAVQSGLLPQYSNTETGFNPSQTTPWSTWDGSRSGPPGFNALGDPSNVTTMEEDQNMVGYGYENEDDDDEDESMHGPEGQEPAKKLSDFEATYQPGQCTLKGCRKGHIFKTFRSYRSHIKNVHTKALWCKVSTCPHPRPFANRSDLNRHYEAKHGDKLNKPFKCLRADCTARAKAFKRKDKLQEHNANYHAEWCCFFCPRRRFETFEACAEHTNRHHVHVTGN